MSEIDTEMYLRDGAPHCTVCKVQMKDGQIGIGVYREVPGLPGADQHSYDVAALSDALAHLNGIKRAEQPPEPEFDLQASLGQPAQP